MHRTGSSLTGRGIPKQHERPSGRGLLQGCKDPRGRPRDAASAAPRNLVLIRHPLFPALAQVCFSPGDLLRKTSIRAFQWRRSPPFFHTCAKSSSDLHHTEPPPAPKGLFLCHFIAPIREGRYILLVQHWNQRTRRTDVCGNDVRVRIGILMMKHILIDNEDI